MNLKKITRFAFLIYSSFIFSGCQSYQEAVRGITHGMGGIMTSDIQQANTLQTELPQYLGLPSDQIQVEADSGTTDVTILGVSDLSARKQIQEKIQNLIAANPNMEPVTVRFE